MHCQNCKTKLKRDSIYCPECGTKVINNIESNKSPQNDDSTVVYKQDANKPKRKTSKIKYAILVSSVLCFLITSLIILLLMKNNYRNEKNITKFIGKEVTTKEDKSSDDEYIFPDSDTEYLTVEDVENLSLDKLALARNEIIARHGRIFTDEKYKSYFESKSWYEGTIEPEEFDANYENELNEIEKSNIELIKQHEALLVGNSAPNGNYKSAYLSIIQADNSAPQPMEYYYLFDMDDNGIPELILAKGESGDTINIYIYSYDSEEDSAYYAGTLYAPLAECYDTLNYSGITVVGRLGDVENSTEVFLKNKAINTRPSDDTEEAIQYYRSQGEIPHYEITDYTPLESESNRSSISYDVSQGNVLGGKYAIIDFDMQATSTLQEKGYSHDVNVLKDKTSFTCWAEGVSGYGIGEKILFTSPDKKNINALFIKPGFTKSAITFNNNGCPTKIKIKCGNIEGEADLSNFQYSEESFLIVKLDRTVSVSECSVTIEDVRKGNKYEDTCITELYFMNLP